MHRRSFLHGLVTVGAVGGAGCLGRGREVVADVQREITVDPSDWWVTEVPDVSDPGGAIRYVAAADASFDVYFFVGRSQLDRYRAYIEDGRGGRLPRGDAAVGTTATRETDGTYAAATPGGGDPESIDEAGPYFFVLDNTNYPVGGGAYVSSRPAPRSVFLDLTVTRDRIGLPV